MLKVCLNGDRPPRERVPVTPVQLAEAARAAVDAGASAIHLHPRGDLGRESLDGKLILTTLAAVRELVPGVPVGVSTREAICPDARERLALVREWAGPEEGGPDFASVNWHETGSVDVARMLRARGIGVEAGIWTPTAASVFIASHWPWQVERVLVEAIPGTVDVARAALGPEAPLRHPDRPRGHARGRSRPEGADERRAGQRGPRGAPPVTDCVRRGWYSGARRRSCLL